MRTDTVCALVNVGLRISMNKLRERGVSIPDGVLFNVEVKEVFDDVALVSCDYRDFYIARDVRLGNTIDLADDVYVMAELAIGGVMAHTDASIDIETLSCDFVAEIVMWFMERSTGVLGCCEIRSDVTRTDETSMCVEMWLNSSGTGYGMTAQLTIPRSLSELTSLIADISNRAVRHLTNGDQHG